MKILITNDDGIRGEGLKVLARWARKLGDVTVAAPSVEQSCKSHGIQVHNPFGARQVEFLPEIPAWSVDSTPADCIRFAVIGLEQKFDLVLSGINRGYNIGLDMVYSGTVGAIMEGACLGIPGIAFSTWQQGFESAEAHLDEVYDYMQRHELPALHSLYNVNIPPKVRGIRITRQGGAYYSDDFHPIGGDLYRPMGKCVYEEGTDFSVDTHAVLHDYISISPMTLERTDPAAFSNLSKLNSL